MKKIALLLSVLSTTAVFAKTTRAIYGEDNRKDVYTVTDALQLKMAATTAAMIERSHIKNLGTHSVISARSLGEFYKLCPNEKFRNQPTAANCSGTLVGTDLIMTASHCYELEKLTCRDYVWVFDYKVSSENQGTVTVPNSSIYECAGVPLSKMDLFDGIDHALVQLKTPANRPFAKLSDSKKLTKKTPLVLIGHPRGLPTKIAAGGFALKIDKNVFKTNLDAFTVNSGSGVFNGITGEVEGILSSGGTDFDGKSGCTISKTFTMEEGNENVVKPKAVAEFLKNYAPGPE